MWIADCAAADRRADRWSTGPHPAAADSSPTGSHSTDGPA